MSTEAWFLLFPPRRAEHLMGMPELLDRWTAARVRALPEDGKRYEVVDGELFVTPAPRFDHQEAVARVLFRLDAYLRGSGIGHAAISPADILSPSSVRADRTVKRRRFQRAGIPEYWVVDLDARLIERWRPGDERPEILAERLVWQPQPEAAPLELDLPTLFAEVLQDGE